MALKLRDKLNRITGSAERIRREISELSELNRAQPDSEREGRLVELRHRLFLALERRPPDQTPPEQLRSVDGVERPRVVDGLPEVDAPSLDPLAIRSAMLSHGALLVRGLMDRDRAARLREGIDIALADRDGYLAGGSVDDSADGPTTPHFDPFTPDKRYDVEAAGWNRIKEGSGAVWVSDSPRMLFELLEAFGDAGILQVAAAYLGEEPTFSMNKSVLRRSPPGTGSAWHQDGAFLGRDIRTLNVWLALSDCGEDAPGMDLVPKRLPILQTGTHGATFVWSVADQLVEEVAEGEPIASPVFEPGDALLFDHLNLHRTGVRPEMDKMRYATETWCFAPSSFPDDLIPVVL